MQMSFSPHWSVGLTRVSSEPRQDLVDINKLILRFVSKGRGKGVATKTATGGIKHLTFQTCCIVSAVKTVFGGGTHRSRSRPTVHTRTCRCGDSQTLTGVEVTLDLDTPLYIHTNSRWIIQPNVSKTKLQFVEENLCDLGLDQGFLRHGTKGTIHEMKTHRSDFIKLKHCGFCFRSGAVQGSRDPLPPPPRKSISNPNW